MDVNRLRTGEKIVGAAAVLLFIDMFLKWYGVDFGGLGGIPGSPSGSPTC